MTLAGDGMIPPHSGSTYLAKMDTNGQTLSLKMIIVRSPPDKIVTATVITGSSTPAEDAALAELILKSIRILR